MGINAFTKTAKDAMMYAHELTILQKIQGWRGAPVLLGNSHDDLTIDMEYLRHGSLKHFLSYNPSAKVRTVIMYRTALMLAAFHDMGYTHRDVKPSNICLRGTEEPVLIDYEFANQRRQGLIKKCGSHNYTAPEVLRSDPYDSRCDVWSYGVTLYEVMTRRCFDVGGIEFDQERIERTVRSHEVPHDVRRTLLGCLVVDPTQRADMQWVCSQLEPLVAKSKRVDIYAEDSG